MALSISCNTGVDDINVDSIQSESRGTQQCIANERSDGIFRNSFLCSAEHLNAEKHSRFQKFHHISGNCKKLIHANYDGKHSNGIIFGNTTDEAGLPVKSESPGSIIKSEKPRSQDKNGQKKSVKCRINDDDLLIQQ